MNLTAKQQLSRNPQNAGYSNPIKTYPVPAVTNEDGTISVPCQPVYLIDPTVEPIPMGQFVQVTTKPGGTSRSIATGAVAIGAAGGLTIYTVPAGRKCIGISLTGDYVASATVGNRLVYLRITDQFAQLVWIGAQSAALTAGLTGNYDCSFGVNNATVSTSVRRNIGNTAATSIGVRENCSIGQFPAGYTFIIDDGANVDVADTYDTRMVVTEVDV